MVVLNAMNNNTIWKGMVICQNILAKGNTIQQKVKEYQSKPSVHCLLCDSVLVLLSEERADRG